MLRSLFSRFAEDADRWSAIFCSISPLIRDIFGKHLLGLMLKVLLIYSKYSAPISNKTLSFGFCVSFILFSVLENCQVSPATSSVCLIDCFYIIRYRLTMSCVYLLCLLCYMGFCLFVCISMWSISLLSCMNLFRCLEC